MVVTPQMIPAFVGGTLRPVEKLAVHRQGLRHPAVSVFVTRGDAILLQQRALSKYHTPGLWANTCCTHPNWGEAPEVCAARRLAEELGITGLSLHRAGTVEYRAELQDGLVEHEVVEIFTAEATDGLAIAPNRDEVQAVAWMGLPELVRDVAARPGRYTPWLRIYLDKHRQTIFGTPLAG
jgi:isopentenyl-diphosphate delta-isomerase